MTPRSLITLPYHSKSWNDGTFCRPCVVRTGRNARRPASSASTARRWTVNWNDTSSHRPDDFDGQHWSAQHRVPDSTCRIAAKRLRRDAGATGHNARERDTGERRERGREWRHLPDRGQVSPTARNVGECHRRLHAGRCGTVTLAPPACRWRCVLPKTQNRSVRWSGQRGYSSVLSAEASSGISSPVSPYPGACPDTQWCIYFG